jgi:hypothetical protein
VDREAIAAMLRSLLAPARERSQPAEDAPLHDNGC